MLDLLLTEIFLFYHLEIIACLIGIITYKWYKKKPSKYFLFFLIFTVIIETIGFIPLINEYYPDSQLIKGIKKVSVNFAERNDWLYNIYWFFFFSYYFFYYYLESKARNNKKLIIIFLSVYVISFLVEYIIFYKDFNFILFKYSRIIGTLSFFIVVCMYLYEIIRGNEIISFYLTLPFWITLGSLFFMLFTVPIFIFSDLTNQSSKILSFYLTILDISNYILYGCFIIGFIINAYQEKKKLKSL